MFYKGFRHLALSQQQLTFFLQNKANKIVSSAQQLYICYWCLFDSYRKFDSTLKATVSVCSDKRCFNDKPADGFQQKRESKLKKHCLETSIESFTGSSPSEQIIPAMQKHKQRGNTGINKQRQCKEHCCHA